MEKLSDIDVNGDNVLELGEIFEVDNETFKSTFKNNL